MPSAIVVVPNLFRTMVWFSGQGGGAPVFVCVGWAPIRACGGMHASMSVCMYVVECVWGMGVGDLSLHPGPAIARYQATDQGLGPPEL